MTSSDLINWNTVSKVLTGNPDYIRKNWVGTNKIPTQFKKQISELLSLVESWQVKNSK